MPTSPLSLRESLKVWARVAALSFGGPAGQIAVMHRIVVEEKKWVGESRFLHALNYCTLLPGPEAQQLATYLGWMFHGVPGGLLAGGLFVLPGFVSLLALSILYAYGANSLVIQAIFFGLKPAVLAVVVEALVRIGKRVLKNRTMYVIAGAAFVAIFFLHVPFPLIVLAAGLFGWLGGKRWPELFPSMQRKADGSIAEAATLADALPPLPRPTILRALGTAAFWLTLWFAPLAVLWAFLGPDHVLTTEGVFFSKTAVVTFGGAYAVLAYVAQQAVERHQWLRPGEMLDGLGMCETTPGPLIQVVQFVAFLGAWRHPEPFSPLTAGILGSCIATWVTFVPSFLWIFLGAPYMERLRGNRSLSTALASITAAVVGVILNLSVWFTINTLFGKVDDVKFRLVDLSWLGSDAEARGGFVHLSIPVWSTVSWPAVGLAAMAFLLLFRFHRGMLTTLAICCAIGAAIYLGGHWLAPPAVATP